jgi:hypothetical protein
MLAAVRFIRMDHGAAGTTATGVWIPRRGKRRRLHAALGCERLKPTNSQRVENGFRKPLGTGCLLQQVFKLPHVHLSMPGQFESNRIVPAMQHCCLTRGKFCEPAHTARFVKDGHENAA